MNYLSELRRSFKDKTILPGVNDLNIFEGNHPTDSPDDDRLITVIFAKYIRQNTADHRYLSIDEFIHLIRQIFWERNDTRGLPQ